MSDPELTGIPLPNDDFPKNFLHKKTAKEMLEEALKDHKSTMSREISPTSKQITNETAPLPTGPTVISAHKGEQESSQSIVDVLFKDFISKKFSGALKVGAESGNKALSTLKTNSVDDELSRLLDMEINSIKSKTLLGEEINSPENLAKVPKSSQQNVSYKKHHLKSERDNYKRSESDLHLQGSSEKNITNASKEQLEPSPTLKTNLNDIGHSYSSNATNTLSRKSDILASSLTTTKNNLQRCSQDLSTNEGTQIAGHEVEGTTSKSQLHSMVPVSVAKKLAAPKQLKMKLSTESLSLIKSTDRIDRDGRVWEEGEVYSSHSERSDKNKSESDSEQDGYPSDTGSINSGSGGWPATGSKHKKKHKHKHKRKKKKHSKDKEHKTKDKVKKLKDEQIDRENELHKDNDSNCSSEQKSDKERTREKDRHDSFEDKSSDWEKSRKRDEDSARKRKRSHSRSRSRKHPKKSKSEIYSRSPHKHGSSMESERSYYNEWDARSYSGDVDKRSSRDRSRSKEHSSDRYKRGSRDKKSKSKDRHRNHSGERSDRHRESSREKSERDLRLQIDKAKLRKIAIANALQNMKAGQGPRVDLTTFKSGGKSVEELTEFCKKISAKSDLSDSDDEVPKCSDDEDKLIHHPFKVRDPSSSSIIMNIRNAKQLPVLTPSEKQAQQATLRLTFPVSSGSHHRASESEWVPVEKTPTPVTPAPSSSTKLEIIEKPIPEEPKKVDSIFPDPAEGQKIDIGSIISERLQAVRKLQENPYDVQALTKMHKVQEQASRWATSKHLPGQFLGTTGAHVLSQEELIGDKKHQAWAKKAVSTNTLLLRERHRGA